MMVVLKGLGKAGRCVGDVWEENSWRWRGEREEREDEAAIVSDFEPF